MLISSIVLSCFRNMLEESKPELTSFDLGLVYIRLFLSADLSGELERSGASFRVAGSFSSSITSGVIRKFGSLLALGVAKLKLKAVCTSDLGYWGVYAGC